MPLIWLMRAKGYRVARHHRLTWVDWMHPLLRLAAGKRWRVFYLGGREGVAERGLANLRREIPDLQAQSADGFFSSQGNESRIRMIAEYRPDVLIVGMGMPRQEFWIAENLGRIDAKVILTSGAAIEYFAGVAPIPPRWLGRLGLEWAYRLVTNPGRYWRRYLVEPCILLPYIVRDIMGGRQ